MWDMFWRFRRRKRPQPLDLVDDGSFDPVAQSRDPAASDVAVLDAASRAGVDLGRPLLLRHLVEVPLQVAAAALEQFSADGYRAQLAASAEQTPGLGSGLAQLQADKTVVATGLGVAQERARVAGMVARFGGEVHGWQLLAPPAPPAGPDGYDRGNS